MIWIKPQHHAVSGSLTVYGVRAEIKVFVSKASATRSTPTKYLSVARKPRHKHKLYGSSLSRAGNIYDTLGDGRYMAGAAATKFHRGNSARREEGFAIPFLNCHVFATRPGGIYTRQTNEQTNRKTDKQMDTATA